MSTKEFSLPPRLDVSERSAEAAWIRSSERDLQKLLAMSPQERMLVPDSRLEDLWPAHREHFRIRLLSDAEADAVRRSWANMIISATMAVFRAADGAKRRAQGFAPRLTAPFRRRAPAPDGVAIDADVIEMEATKEETVPAAGGSARPSSMETAIQAAAAIASVAAVSIAIRAAGGHTAWAAMVSDAAPLVVFAGAWLGGRAAGRRWTAALKTCAAVQGVVAAGGVLEILTRWPVDGVQAAVTAAMVLGAAWVARTAWRTPR